MLQPSELQMKMNPFAFSKEPPVSTLLKKISKNFGGQSNPSTDKLVEGRDSFREVTLRGEIKEGSNEAATLDGIAFLGVGA